MYLRVLARYALLTAVVWSGCGGGVEPSSSIGGTVSGLVGTGLVLQNNNGDDFEILADGPFTFPTQIAFGETYAVTVRTQPSSPSQTCTVANGTGTTDGESVTNIAVTCVTDVFTVGGAVTGLSGMGLVLQNNAGDTLPITADGTFTFATPVASGAPYAVTVMSQPTDPTQMCTVANGSGTIGAANVTDVQVTCMTSSFTIGGVVSGLAGSGLILRNNGGDDLAVAADGTFTFTTPVASGTTFDVTVYAQPTGPSQTCTVSGGTGTVGGGNVTSVMVDCATDRFTIGGSISGLAGTVVLQNNAGDDLTVTSNGTFAFSTTVASGDTYAVTVLTQPTAPSQNCVVSAGSGSVTNADITDVVVTCALTCMGTTGSSQTFNATGMGRTGTVQTFTVPTGVCEITIEASGAQGGTADGGKGAQMRGTFAVSAGQVLKIVTGQQGTVNTCGGSGASGGGGGGSFVWDDANPTVPLIAAGGGGGGNTNWSDTTCRRGIDAVTTMDGTNGNSATSAAGGINGNGGSGTAPSGVGSGGAGWLSAGGNSTYPVGSTGGETKFTFSGGLGPQTSFGPGGDGGFGGGGGAVCGCGGGGGYSGGGAGEGSSCRAGGGGGGSFNAGTNQVNTPGVQLGNGVVTISW